MATADSVKSKLQELIDTANAATGNADTDLTTAVNSLVAGFGQGGDGPNPFVSIEDFVVAVSATNTQAVSEYFKSVITEQTDPTSHIVVAFIAKEKPTTNSVNNAFVSVIYTVQNTLWQRSSNVLRWRDNAYQNAQVSEAYDCILNAGDELYKITINARGV